MLVASGSYTPSSEYPGVKQVSLGPQVEFKDLKDSAALFEKEFDFRRFQSINEANIREYNVTFEKFKNAAIEYNIDMFVCYIAANDACLDVAHTLKIPVVGFGALLYGT